MSEIPSELKYTAEHEWVRVEGGSQTVRVGITDYAQQALGDVVYVSLPDVGSEVSAGAACGEVESTKSVSDLYAPVSGTVTARNDALDQQPELINSDPYGDGWVLEIEIGGDADSAAAELLDAAAYGALAT
ncbi:MAG TPA: glycine cleavage system protein GcvH [Jatrophihabitantaceae bacterium]|jgi:glycine cleavage system H protein